MLPIRVSTVDRTVAASAITWSPVVGMLLGGLATGVLWVLARLHSPSLLAGLLVVGLLAVVTRGMHVDGLADTADGFGCYGPPERALAVMKDGGAGPFAVVTLIVVLGAQAASLGVVGIGVPALAITAGRAAFSLSCRRSVPAARPEGLGALVAGSQAAWVPLAWWALLAAGSAFVLPGRWWQGLIAVGLAAGLVELLVRHASRRFGGVTGDVLGAASEVATTTVLVVCALS